MTAGNQPIDRRHYLKPAVKALAEAELGVSRGCACAISHEYPSCEGALVMVWLSTTTPPIREAMITDIWASKSSALAERRRRAGASGGTVGATTKRDELRGRDLSACGYREDGNGAVT